MKSLIIGLDGFKYDYLKHTSFLKSYCKESQSGELTTLLGFRGIFATFFTGKNQDEHNVFTEFKFTPYSTLKQFGRPLFNNFSKYQLSLIANTSRIIRKKSFIGRIPNSLPINYLKYFDFSLDKNFFEKNAFPVKSIFDILREKKKKFIFTHYPVIGTNNTIKYDFLGKNDDGFKSKRIEEFFKKNYDFYFLDLSEPDRTTHKYGTKHKITIEKIKELDNLLESLATKFKGNVLIWSDHGFVDVKKRINVKKRLSNLKLKDGKDYLAFLDSTMIRFWFFNKRAKDIILNEFKDIKLLTQKDKEKYGINFKNRFYGDEIFLLKEGSVVEPDYFEGHVNAMHGYLPGSYDMKTFYLINNDKGKKNRNMKEMFNLMKNLI